MKTAGIIAEYNPLHYGHLHLLQAVRQRFGEDTAVICAMHYFIYRANQFFPTNMRFIFLPIYIIHMKKPYLQNF